MPPPNAYGDQSIDPGFVGGINSMQYQAGFGGGGRPNFPPPFVSPLRDHGVSPYARPAGYMPFAPITPIGGDFGSGHRMAQQAEYQAQGGMTAFGQAAVGVGARLGVGLVGAKVGAISGAAAGASMGMLFGPVGAAAGATAGGVIGGFAGYMGADSLMGDFAQRAGESLLSPLTAGRQRSLTLQNTSTNYLRRGPDMAPGGIGMSLGAATGLQQNLMHMADSKGFQRETGGRFNRQDVMKITQLAGEVGMLDQSQTAQEVATSVSKISKALANIMKIAGEPDVKKAMQMMGQMRMAGMSIPETQTAMSNAKVFARMAGVSVGDVVAGAGQAASMFQERGMSGAAGINAGMASMGMAGMAASTMSARQLSMAGGKEGVQQTYMQAAADTASQDVLNFGAFTRKGGKLQLDMGKLRAMGQGKLSTSDAVRQTADSMGGMQNVMEVMSTRSGEMRDAMQTAERGMLATLMPIINARALQKETGTTLGAALMMGNKNLTKEQARTIESNAGNRDWWRGLREQAGQQKVDNRESIARQRANIQERASVWDMTTDFKEFFGGQTIDRYSRRQADLTDIEVQTAASGGPLLAAGTRAIGSSDIQEARMRDMTTMGQTKGVDFTAAMRRASAKRQNIEATSESISQESQVVSRFYGAEGWGLTEARRGGLTDIGLVAEQRSVTEGIAYAFGLGDTVTAKSAANTAKRRATSGMRIEKAEISNAMTRREDHEAVMKSVQNVKGIDENTANEVLNRAAAAMAEKADASHHWWKPNEKIEETDFQNVIKDAAKAAGVTDPAAINVLLSNASKQHVTNRALQSTTSRGKGILSEAAVRGAQASTLAVARRVGDITRASNAMREEAGEKAGITLGFWSGGKEEELSVLGGIVAGSTDQGTAEGKQTDIRQTVLRIKALEKQGKGEEASALQNELDAKYKGKDMVLVDQATSEVETTLAKHLLTDEAQAKFLKNVTTSKTTLAAVGVQFNDANANAMAIGGTQTYGATWSETLEKSGATAAYKELAGSQGFKDINLDDDERQLIEQAGKGSVTAQATLLDINTKRAEAAKTAAGATNLARLNEDGQTSLQTTIGALSQTAQDMGTDEFTVATGKFSEASDKLAKAAEVLSGQAAMDSIGSAMSQASTQAKASYSAFKTWGTTPILKPIF